MVKLAWVGVLAVSVVVACGADRAGAGTRPPEPAPVAPRVEPAPLPEAVAEPPAPVTVDAASPASADAGAATEVPAAPEPEVAKPAQPFRPVVPCVNTEADAKHRIRTRGPNDEGTGSEGEVVLSYDLDGDGVDDELRNGGVWSTTHRVWAYVRRGKCGHFVGMIETRARLDLRATSHKGLFDLGGPHACQPSCCESLPVEEWHFDGVRYRLGATGTQTRKCPGF